MLATVVAVASADFFFTVPYYSLRVAHLIDIIIRSGEGCQALSGAGRPLADHPDTE